MSATREAVESLLDEGLRPSEIARRLGLAPQTISYHADRIRRGVIDGRKKLHAPVEIDESIRRRPTRAAVAELLKGDRQRADVARMLDISKATVSYHARRLGLKLNEDCARRYDWTAIQRYHDDGHSRRECIERFGLSRSSWYDAVKRGVLRARPGHTPLEELLVSGIYRSRDNLKARLLAAGLKKRECERCGLSDWRGTPLSLALHHVNGDRQDNRLENLQLLCPNCHSQTENFAGRNGRRGGSGTRVAGGLFRGWRGGLPRRARGALAY